MADWALPEYAWIFYCAIPAAILFGYATGSNDVANAFATSVGSKTLTMKQAVIIASIFEFLGGILLGRVSTNVLASGITDITVFESAPEFYAYGMLCALTIGGFWQLFASYKGYNVSATHTIIGAIVGFSIVYDGFGAVQWAKKDTGSFPPYKGVVAIIMSWFFSPILTGLSAAFIFFLCRLFVLRSNNRINRSYYVLPFAVFLTIWINIYFIFVKGAAKTLSTNNDWSKEKSALIALGCAIFFALCSIFIAIPLMKRSAAKDKRNTLDITELNTENIIEISNITNTYDKTEENSDNIINKSKLTKYYIKTKKLLTKGTTYDIHEVVQTNDVIKKIHEHAEKFDPEVEVIFSYLQVFSAIALIFSHGSNEVGYMVGPLNGIYDVIKTGEISITIDPKIWILVVCCLSLVLGLATYGYNVTRTMGVEMCKLSPTRGFSAELATSMTIMVASQYGLPTSSSQCIIGAIIGVGCLEGINGLNKKVIIEQFLSWGLTLCIAIGGTAALFAQAVYAPSKNC